MEERNLPKEMMRGCVDDADVDMRSGGEGGSKFRGATDSYSFV